MAAKTVVIQELSLIPNVCDQELREVWKNDKASMAHVVMAPGNSSLPHWHDTFTEVYIILSGGGRLYLDEEVFGVAAGTVVEILPGVRHQLIHDGDEPLVHYVLCTPPFDPSDVIML